MKRNLSLFLKHTKLGLKLYLCHTIPNTQRGEVLFFFLFENIMAIFRKGPPISTIVSISPNNSRQQMTKTKYKLCFRFFSDLIYIPLIRFGLLKYFVFLLFFYVFVKTQSLNCLIYFLLNFTPPIHTVCVWCMVDSPQERFQAKRKPYAGRQGRCVRAIHKQKRTKQNRHTT